MLPIIFLYFSLIFILFSCQNSTDQVHQEPHEIFCLTDTLLRNLKTEKASFQTVQNELVLSGKITAREERTAKIFPLVSGTIEDLKISLGDYVQKGQVLALIRSGEVADYDNQLIAAQSNMIVAQKNLDVAEDMYRSGLASEKELITARNELKKAEAEIEKIKKISTIYSFSGNSLYSLKSPISGFVVERSPDVTENMQFDKAEVGAFFTIAELEEVFVVANVYESDIPKVKEGYDCEIRIQPYPDEIFKGKIEKVMNVLNPQTHTMKIRIRITNIDFKLKPEMFANVTVKYAEGESKMAVPSKALIFDKNRYFVMVYKDRCQIETREVKIYKAMSSNTYLLSGLKEGEEVMTQYQLLVYDALND